MCRSIKPLFNFEPPATDEEVRAASLQFVRKLSGFQSPSKNRLWPVRQYGCFCLPSTRCAPGANAQSA